MLFLKYIFVAFCRTYWRLLLLHLQMSVRGKNKKERLGGFFKSITKTADEVLISGQKVSSKEGLS